MPDEYTITFPAPMLDVLSAGLLELQGKFGLPVLQHIQAQVNRQNQPPAPVLVEPEGQGGD